MASIPFKFLTGLLIAFLISAILSFALVITTSSCSNERSPEYCDLCCGLDKNCNFKSRDLRLMAERIYEYRLEHEYTPPSDTFISIFMMRNKPDPANLPAAESLSDIALHHLVTATDKFSLLISYIPIFNHPRYIDCLKAFDQKTRLFRGIDSERSTKDIIIQDILGFGDESNTKEIVSLYDECVKGQEPTNKNDCIIEGPITYDQQCLIDIIDSAKTGAAADKTKCIVKMDPKYDDDCLAKQKRQVCLSKLGIDIDISDLRAYMIAYLTNSSDDSLYRLLVNGFTGATLSMSLP